MPAMKCPACGYRYLQPIAQCLNCGEPLAASYSPPPDNDVPVVVEAPSTGVDTDDAEVAEYERFLAESKQEENSRLHFPASKSPNPSARRTRSKGLRISEEQQPELNAQIRSQNKPPDSAPSHQLIVRPGDALVADQDWRKQYKIQPYEIYETALDIMPPETFSPHPRTGSTSASEQAIDPELWKTDKLPWHFPRTKPTIAGAVILIEAKEEIVDYPDLYAAIATLLVELIWVFAQVQQEKETGSRVVMTMVRVKTYDGTLKDSRIRGNMRGANISLGDQVSFWGKKRNGVVYVRHGFNHTTGGVISTYSMGLMMPALIVIVAFIIGFYIFPSWLPLFAHHFLSAIEAFFSFWSKHPLATPSP